MENESDFDIMDDPTTTEVPTTTTATLTDASASNGVDNNIWYIIGGVGILVLIIIIAQTIALCYFRRKAQPRRRMDNMRPRSRFGFDRGDRARYSAPPCKKSKASTNRAQADTDSHIYEMVGVNALYNKSSDIHPEANPEKNIKDRPPLPLPHEIPKPVPAETLSRKPSPMTSMPSTLSLASSSSSSTLINKKKGKQLPPPPEKVSKKAPARPPKQIDEDSMPGSLRRPAMPIPAPAPAAAPVSAPAKTLPKPPSTESPMSELKNIFRKRNAGKDTQTAVRPEKKDPPKVKAKTNPPKPVPSQKPPSLTKPSQPNQIKLIMPKIEAVIKPKPMTNEPMTSPIKLPVTPAKVTPKLKPVPEKLVLPKPVVQKPVAQKPVPQKPAPQPPKPTKSVQNRPLPKPETSRELPPEPVYPDPPPSPPIYMMTGDDDFTPEDDDDEWTYEQLGQYNIYNI